MFDDVEKILAVFDEYKKQLDKLDPQNNSLVLKAIQPSLLQIKTGELVDHVNLVDAMTKINTCIVCNNEVMVLSNTQCPSDTSKTCKDLKVETGLVVPACMTDAPTIAECNTAFNNAKKSMTETIALMDSFVASSYDTSTDTPNKLLQATLVKFRVAVSTFDLIKVDMQATLDLVKNNNLMDGTNCKIIRAEFQSLEHSLCFDFVPNIYKFMLVALIASAFFFSFIWHFCCATFCLERSGEHGEDAEYHQKFDNEAFKPGKNENYGGH